MAYVKNTWETGDVITAEKLNHMENGIEGVESGNTIYFLLLDSYDPVDPSGVVGALYYDKEMTNKICDVYSVGYQTHDTYEDAVDEVGNLRSILENYEWMAISWQRTRTGGGGLKSTSKVPFSLYEEISTDTRVVALEFGASVLDLANCRYDEFVLVFFYVD